jgi:hypothetical protein
MPTPDVSLTPDEQALFDTIELDWDALDHEGFIRNGERVVALMKSLLARKGIPEVRVKYFTDPAYRTGRMKGSHRDIFHRNGHTDDSMMRHAHFLDFLRYFVCGPNLPASALKAFRHKAAACGTITSDDVIPLAKFARREARERGLTPHDACEEYFKLALDCGMWVDYAFTVRDQVKTIK